MSDLLLQETYSYLTQEDGEPILLENSLPVIVKNYQNVTSGDGMSCGEQMK